MQPHRGRHTVNERSQVPAIMIDMAQTLYSFAVLSHGPAIFSSAANRTSKGSLDLGQSEHDQNAPEPCSRRSGHRADSWVSARGTMLRATSHAYGAGAQHGSGK